jgi:ABC transporter DrrB family efflux protein
VIFLLLFRYVFGGAINVGHTGYTNYIIAGIFVQTAAIAGLAAGTGMAQDLQSGLIDRFRSLPIGRSTVLIGRVVATLVRSLMTLLIVALFGLVVGFRPASEPLGWLQAVGLLLLFGLAMSWIGVAIGLLVRNVEAVQNLTMTLVFPITFLSSAFVPPQTMPSVLRIFVANQPMTHVVDAVSCVAVREGQRRMTATAFNRRTIDEFHAKQGRGVMGWGDLLLLMTSTGVRSGRQITTPLVHRRKGDVYVVVASKGGAPDDPLWHRNIQAQPAVTVEVAAGSGTERFSAQARTIPPGPERDELYAFMTEVWPAFAEYARRTERTIPVVVLERSTPETSDEAD